MIGWQHVFRASFNKTEPKQTGQNRGNPP